MSRSPATALPATQRILRLILEGAGHEQLAETCLSSALPISGASLGWVGLLNAHGRLDTIAVSAGAWEAGEEGADPSFELPQKGLWATVLEDAQPRIVNRPSEHPARAELPPGHTPIHNFLGLPLIIAGRVVGMVALANRTGGFDKAQLESLLPLVEALSVGLHHRHTEADLGLQAAVFRTLPDGIAVCDTDGVVTHTNPAFRSAWGMADEDTPTGWPLRDIVRLEGGDPDDCILAPAKGIPWRGEAIATPEDGPPFPLEILANPILDAGGHPAGVCVTMRDITEWKADEERMWTATEELSRSNQDLERFAHLAARELQAPLRKVLAYGEFLESDCGHQLDKLGREYLGRILESARRQQATVEGLLRYSKLRCNEASFTRVELGQLVRDVVGELRPLLRELGGSIQLGASTPIRCDEALIRLMLEQLMDNGLRYHRPGVPPELHVSAQQEGAWCSIQIEDNGTGFDERQLHHMFQVFGRLSAASEHRGTGLGLPLAQRVVEQHGGTITASSTPGRGSIFTVTLPHRLDRAPYVAPALRTDTFAPVEEES
jgi:PAS domain S-box-containing protein